MDEVGNRLAAAGFELPAPPAALGDYLPAVRAGDLVFTAGQLPLVGGVLHAAGMVGEQVPLEVAAECARVCALNALAAAATVCELGSVRRAVRLTGYIACGESFTDQPLVLDGASAVLLSAFGEDGRHAREAVGVAALPRGAPVEVSLVLHVSAR